MPNPTHLSDLLLEWEERRDAQRPLSPEQLCHDCPELLEPLKAQLRALEALSPVLSVQTTPETWRPNGTVQMDGKRLPQVPGYEILEELGRGGMGVVYQARQTGLNRIVALKMILGGAHAGKEQLARFQIEAEAIARLRHPNIVQIYQIGEHDGLPFFSLEYIDGGTLSQYVKQHPLTPRQAAELLETLARAIHAAHQQGIIHRDLKPANVLLKRDVRSPESGARIKPHDAPLLTGDSCLLTPSITDFGLAKRLEATDAPTKSNWIMGTPAYMSPEQAQGRTQDVGPASDLYALGAILYDLLTRRPPFQAATPFKTIDLVITKEPVPPRKLVPSIPRDLETICLKCLEKSPSQRYASAEALADDLRRFLDHRPIQARPTPSWERAAKWVRRRPRLAAGLLAALLLVFMGTLGGVWYWDANYRLKTAHYVTFTRRWGAWEGVGPLTDEQAKHREVSLRFFSRGGQVEKVEAINGQGERTTHHQIGSILGNETVANTVHCWYEFRRDDHGRVVEEIAHDRADEVVWRFVYVTPTRGHFTDKSGFPRSRSTSGAAYLEFQYSPDGLEREVRFLDRDAQPRPNHNGVWGLRNDYDDRGLAVGLTSLDREGRPMLGPEGHATVRQARNAMGLVTEEAVLDAASRPVLNAKGYSRATLEYDANGNCTRLDFFGLQGQRILQADGYAYMRKEYDDRGGCIRQSYFGLADEPVVNSTEGYARVELTRDNRGQATQQLYYGPDGKPMVNPTMGCAGIRSTFNAQGLEKAVTLLDTRGQPFVTSAGFATIRYQYNPRGQLTEESYYDKNDQPVISKLNCFRMTRDYDDRGNKIAEAYFDLAGKPCFYLDGSSRTTYEYDRRNNLITTIFHGLDGQPAPCNAGYAIRRQKRDEDGNLAEESYYDAAGQLMATKNGYARLTSTYDDQGNRVEVAYWNSAGQPVRHKTKGYARAQWTFDTNHREVGVTYFDEKGQPVSVPQTPPSR